LVLKNVALILNIMRITIGSNTVLTRMPYFVMHIEYLETIKHNYLKITFKFNKYTSKNLQSNKWWTPDPNCRLYYYELNISKFPKYEFLAVVFVPVVTYLVSKIYIDNILRILFCCEHSNNKYTFTS